MDDSTFWDCAFCQLVGIQAHPANHLFDDPELLARSVANCAALADVMLDLRRKRWPSVRSSEES